MPYRLTCAVALLALAACDRPQEKGGGEMSPEEVAEQLAQVKIDPGQWESTTKILSASGPLPQEALDRMVGKTTSVSNCITPEQAARPSANFLAAQNNADCAYRDFRMQDGKLSGTMSCTGGEMPGEMVTTMKGDYGSQSYDMTMDMETTGLPGVALKITARTQGRRVGDCA